MMKDNKFWTMFTKKPGSFLLLGACPALGAAAELKTGLTAGLMALALLVVLTVLAMALKGVVGKGFRLAVFTLLAVALCSAAGMELHAKLPQVYAAMGVYTALMGIAVAFFAVAQTEAEVSFGGAVVNALKAGLLFVIALALTAAVCELFGSGSIWGAEAAGLAGYKTAVLTQSAGRILVYGLAAAVCNALFTGKKEGAK